MSNAPEMLGNLSSSSDFEQTWSQKSKFVTRIRKNAKLGHPTVEIEGGANGAGGDWYVCGFNNAKEEIRQWRPAPNPKFIRVRPMRPSAPMTPRVRALMTMRAKTQPSADWVPPAVSPPPTSSIPVPITAMPPSQQGQARGLLDSTLATLKRWRDRVVPWFGTPPTPTPAGAGPPRPLSGSSGPARGNLWGNLVGPGLGGALTHRRPPDSPAPATHQLAPKGAGR